MVCRFNVCVVHVCFWHILKILKDEFFQEQRVCMLSLKMLKSGFLTRDRFLKEQDFWSVLMKLQVVRLCVYISGSSWPENSMFDRLKKSGIKYQISYHSFNPFPGKSGLQIQQREIGVKYQISYNSSMTIKPLK